MKTDSPRRWPIACTQDNVQEFREVVKAWPEVHDLVKSLQAQGLFPGLRAMRITPLGDAKTLGDVLASLQAENAPEADSVGFAGRSNSVGAGSC